MVHNIVIITLVFLSLAHSVSIWTNWTMNKINYKIWEKSRLFPIEHRKINKISSFYKLRFILLVRMRNETFLQFWSLRLVQIGQFLTVLLRFSKKETPRSWCCSFPIKTFFFLRESLQYCRKSYNLYRIDGFKTARICDL